VGGTTAAAHASGVTVSQNLCIVSSTGTAGNAKRVVEGALGAGAMSSPGAMGTMGADAMVVYAKGTALTGGGFDRNVYYRLWDSSVNDWGAEQTAQQVSANSSPVFIVVRFARTRNEAIMGVLDGNSQLFIQVWNGRTWTIPAGGGPLTTASTNTARTFQIAYEYTSDIARIVYQDGGTRDPQYATWNGTTLTANGMILPRAVPTRPRTPNKAPLVSACAAQRGRQQRHSPDFSRLASGRLWPALDRRRLEQHGGQRPLGHHVTNETYARLSMLLGSQTHARGLCLWGCRCSANRYRTWNAGTATLTPTGNGSASSS